MPVLSPQAAGRLASLVHPEHREWAQRWAWLLDSFVGGDRYRLAVYGTDRKGMPVRNLVRHKREYPEQPEAWTAPYSAGFGPAGVVESTDDDYALRLARTPVPDLFPEVIRKHLGRIYAEKVERDGPPEYLAWCDDVDGRGTGVDVWMMGQVAPYVKTYGCLDILCDHPEAPPGEEVATRADADRLNLSAVRARAIHPQDVTWWEVDERDDYRRVTVRERAEVVDERTGESKAVERYRHWDADSWTLVEDGKVVASGGHPYGRPPIVRVYYEQHPCYRHVGRPPHEGIAEQQREYYNRDSELILSDTTQAHPILQGPEDYIGERAELPIGPGYLLPKRKSMTGSSVSYEGFDVIDFPKGGAESIRVNKGDIRDAVDRSAGLAKPAGATGAGPVAQSGVSKSFDHAELGDLLASDADKLAAVERRIAGLVLLVASDGEATPEAIASVSVGYSHKFDLLDAEQLADGLAAVQEAISSAGAAPGLEARVIYAMAMRLLDGLDEGDREQLWREIEAAVGRRAEERSRAAEQMAEDMAGQDDGGEGDEPDPEPDRPQDEPNPDDDEDPDDQRP